jgi:hypothetical protein
MLITCTCMLIHAIADTHMLANVCKCMYLYVSGCKCLYSYVSACKACKWQCVFKRKRFLNQPPKTCANYMPSHTLTHKCMQINAFALMYLHVFSSLSVCICMLVHASDSILPLNSSSPCPSAQKFGPLNTSYIHSHTLTCNLMVQIHANAGKYRQVHICNMYVHKIMYASVCMCMKVYVSACILLALYGHTVYHRR